MSKGEHMDILCALQRGAWDPQVKYLKPRGLFINTSFLVIQSCMSLEDKFLVNLCDFPQITGDKRWRFWNVVAACISRLACRKVYSYDYANPKHWDFDESTGRAYFSGVHTLTESRKRYKLEGFYEIIDFEGNQLIERNENNVCGATVLLQLIHETN